MDKEKLKALKKQSNQLKPVIIVGQHGLSENVFAEIDRALHDHELIKIRLNAKDHYERIEMIGEIQAKSGAELVNAIGHVASFYRYSQKLHD